jgi:lipopolysaccharide transport system permease protein
VVGTSIGLLLAPVGMLYGDIARLIPVLTQFAMYVTPVVYVMPTEGLTGTLFRLNPMTPVIHNSRAWLTGSESLWVGPMVITVAVSIAVLLFGWVAYRVTMPRIIERMSS